jgi:hypothetical protein
MSRVLLESLSGVGAIHAGDVLLRTTSYDVSRWSEPDPDGSGQAPRTITSGHIDITGIAEALVLAGPGNLTLTLEDGRRLAFDLTSSGGGIVGRGWLPE